MGRLGRAALIAVFCLTAAPGLRAAAATPTPTPAVVAAEATAAAIAGMEKQLTKISADLVKLQEAVRDAKPAPVSADAAALTALKAEIAALRAAIPTADALTPDQVWAATPAADLRSEVAALKTAVDKLAQTAARPPAPVKPPPDEVDWTMILAGVAAFFSLIALIAIAFVKPKGSGSAVATVERRIHELRADVKQALAPLQAESAAKGGQAPDGAASETVTALRSALREERESNARERLAVEKALARLESAGAGLQPAVETLDTRLREIQEVQAAVAAERAELESHRSELVATQAARAEAESEARKNSGAATEKLARLESRLSDYDRLLPEAFRSDGPLSAWRDRIVAGAASDQPAACALWDALLRWQRMKLVPQRERDRWIQVTDEVGRACHTFLEGEPLDDAAAVLERNQTWTRVFKTALEEAFPSLKLNAVYPGDRFDTDRMEAVSSVSGNRQTVQRPMSWYLLEKTADATRVLRRAQVVTT